MKQDFSPRLTPPQSEVLAMGLLDSGFNCVLQMPTGSGKTWLAEQAMARVVSQGRRAVYLTPLRALGAELHARWSTRFVGAEVGLFTGETTKTTTRASFERASVLLMTPERLDACTRAWRSHWSWIPDVDLLVVDEFHLLGDRQRGPRLEGTLLRFQRLNPFARVLGLSATLGNRTELADWLEGVEYESSWRTVPLEWRVVRYRKATEKPDLLAREAANCVQGGGKSLVFTQSRRRAESLAAFLSTQGLRAGFHHAGLQQTERATTETKFRGGETDVLVATGTLEMGMNFPVRQVVLYDLQYFDSTDFKALPVTNVWQRAGRAGRPGLDERGEARSSGADVGSGGRLLPAWSLRAGPVRPLLRAGPRRAGPRRGCERPLPDRSPARVGAIRLVGPPPGSLRERSEGRGHDDPLRDAHGDSRAKTRLRSGRVRLKATRLGRIAVRQMLSPDTVLRLASCRRAPRIAPAHLLRSPSRRGLHRRLPASHPCELRRARNRCGPSRARAITPPREEPGGPRGGTRVRGSTAPRRSQDGPCGPCSGRGVRTPLPSRTLSTATPLRSSDSARASNASSTALLAIETPPEDPNAPLDEPMTAQPHRHTPRKGPRPPSHALPWPR